MEFTPLRPCFQTRGQYQGAAEGEKRTRGRRASGGLLLPSWGNTNQTRKGGMCRTPPAIGGEGWNAAPGTRKDLFAGHKVARNKPAELVDACYTDAGKVTDAARCQALFPISGNPRMAAGEPMTNDILKCALKPVRRADYHQPISDAQFAKLKTIFATGVCDYGRPGVGQDEPAKTWLGYPRPGVSVPLTGN